MPRELSRLIRLRSSRREHITETTSSASQPTISETAHLVYTPLQDVDEIRLLNIAPRMGMVYNNRSDLTIEHVRLSAEPLYTAVSWMWGPEDDKIEVEIDGHMLEIRQNLGRIIEHLRDTKETRRVWIDAICIDQRSLEERNHQVQLMGQIYSNANCVVACITAERQRDRKQLQNEAKELHCLLREGKTTKTSKYPHLFGNRYFTRRWIIQEIKQARRVTFCCEGYDIPMSLLSDGLKRKRVRTRQEIPREYFFFSDSELIAESRATKLCRVEPETESTSARMEELLYLHETAECSDFHDKIYALLSLTSRAQLHLLVQYSVNRVQLMLSVMDVCSKHEGLSVFRTLSFICFLQQHLEVRMDDFRSSLLNSANPTVSTTFAVKGVVHGKIKSLHTGARVEEGALQFRKSLPSLSVLQALSLKYARVHNSDTITDPAYLEIDRQTSPATLSRPLAKIPGIDQCLFAFVGNELTDATTINSTKDEELLPSPSSTQGPIFAGFAATRVDVGDEIWQFERTPLVVVARKTSKGYNLMGRAFLIRDLCTGFQDTERYSSSRFEDELVWIKDGAWQRQLTPKICLDVKGLYEMITWVNFDR